MLWSIFLYIFLEYFVTMNMMISFDPWTRWRWQRGVNIFKLFIFFFCLKVVKVLRLLNHRRIQFFRLLFPHFLYGNKLELWRRSYIRLSKIVNARVTVNQKWLVNALIIIILKWHLCRWIVRVLPYLHKQIYR